MASQHADSRRHDGDTLPFSFELRTTVENVRYRAAFRNSLACGNAVVIGTAIPLVTVCHWVGVARLAQTVQYRAVSHIHWPLVHTDCN